MPETDSASVCVGCNGFVLFATFAFILEHSRTTAINRVSTFLLLFGQLRILVVLLLDFLDRLFNGRNRALTQ
jgi:hypothetical protein